MWTDQGEIVAASPYSFLVRKDATAIDPHQHILRFKTPSHWAVIGDFLLGEAKAQLEAIRREYPKDRERELRMVIGLHIDSIAAHVVPALDPEAVAWVNPKWLIDALPGRAALLMWSGQYQPQCIVIDSEKHQLWLACMSRPKWLDAKAVVVNCEHKPYNGRCLKCGQEVV